VNHGPRVESAYTASRDLPNRRWDGNPDRQENLAAGFEAFTPYGNFLFDRGQCFRYALPRQRTYVSGGFGEKNIKTTPIIEKIKKIQAPNFR
jgi:hypothetical protein